MSTINLSNFAVGDRVVPNPEMDGHPAGVLGKVFIVRKVGPKNLMMDAEEQGQRGYRAPPSFMKAAPAPGESAPIGRPFRPREFFSSGEVVTISALGMAMLRPSTTREISESTPLVVVKDGDKVNVTKLGGWGDRYLRMPPSALVKRDLAWLTEHLVEAI